MTGKEMGESFMHMMNTMSLSEIKDFTDVVVHDHRTLQQNAMRVFVSCIVEWAKMSEDLSRYGDLRNEQTLKQAKAMMKGVEFSTYFPFV